MLKFKVTKTKDELKISQTYFSLIKSFIGSIFGFLFVTVAFLLLPYDQLIAFHEYAYLVYFIPLLSLIPIFKKINKLITGHTYLLNRKTDQLFYNGRRVERLKNIQQVEWNLESDSERAVAYLDLKSVNGQTYRISTTMTYLNKEHLELGKAIAKFLIIEFVSNDPSEKEIIWGKAVVDEKSIGYINNTNPQ